MGVNSVLSNLTAENTVAEIRMLLSADFAREKTVMLLEGEDDTKVFRFLMDKSVTLIKAYGASTTVDKLMPEHFLNEPRVIGVRDRDYQEQKKFNRIFYCDYCNCEMMLISDDETFEKTAVNFYRGNLSATALRREILQKLFYLSVVRKCSDLFRWAMRISETDLSRIVSPKKRASLSEVIAFVNSYNSKNSITAERAKKLKRFHDSGRTEDYLMITNGHDFVEALRIYCTDGASNSKKRSLSDKVVGAVLRCSYSLDAFRKTQLYEALRCYGEQHSLSIVK